jgi:hypothetical protein
LHNLQGDGVTVPEQSYGPCGPNRPVDPELLKQLESALLGADVGVRTTKEVLAALRQQVNVLLCRGFPETARG